MPGLLRIVSCHAPDTPTSSSTASESCFAVYGFVMNAAPGQAARNRRAPTSLYPLVNRIIAPGYLALSAGRRSFSDMFGMMTSAMAPDAAPIAAGASRPQGA